MPVDPSPLRDVQDVDQELSGLDTIKDTKGAYPKRPQSAERPMKEFAGIGIFGELKEGTFNSGEQPAIGAGEPLESPLSLARQLDRGHS